MQKTNFITGLVLVSVGFLLLIIPNQIVKAVVIVLGAEAIVNGVFSFLTVRQLVADESFRFPILIRSVISVVVGLLAVFLPLAVAGVMWTVMLYVLGVYLFFAAVMELFAMAKLRDTDINRKQFVFEAIVSIFVAVILFILPRQIGAAILRIFGAVIFVIGGVLLFVSLRGHKSATAEDKMIAESVVVEDDKE